MGKQLVLLVEGDGDFDAVPMLVGRLLRERAPWDCLSLDPNPVRIGGIEGLTGDDKNRDRWLRFLGVAGLRPKTAAVLVVLDGDADRVEGQSFCPARVAKVLAARARAARGGERFSVACVFARQEFESWLVAGVESLAGRLLPDGRPGVRAGTTCPTADAEHAPRSAKDWLRKCMANGYKPTQDQAALTTMVDLATIRAHNPRSFRRLEHALDVLIDAVRRGEHIVSPV